MTQALAQALADIDDPEVVQTVLAELTDDQQPPTPSSDQSTLSDFYHRYLTRRQNRSPDTIAQYKRTLPPFIRYLGNNRILYPSALTTDIVDGYVDTLFDEYDTDATILTYTKNARTWLKWLNKRGLCTESLYRILDKEELGLSPQARDEALPATEASYILQQLRQQRCGSAVTALMELLWNCGPRIGGIHSLDVSDVNLEHNDLYLRHRPDFGTRLKNGEEGDDTPGDGERDIIISDRAAKAIRLYLQTEHPNITDSYGRKPLFATGNGRASRSTLRRWVYEATSCRWLHDGPVDVTCDGSCDPDSNVCPHSYYPHAVRRGAIVAHLSGGLRPDRASGRFDVSTSVIKRHYDPRVKEQRKADREDAVRDAWNDI